MSNQHHNPPNPNLPVGATPDQARSGMQADHGQQESEGSVGGIHVASSAQQTWTVEAPTESETWALCHGAGWYDGTQLDERLSLADEVAALSIRKQRLTDEISAAIAAGRANGKADAMREFAPALAELHARYTSKYDDLTQAATNAALAVASALVMELSAADEATSRAADRIRDAISQHLPSDAGAGAPNSGLVRARCAPGEREHLQSQLPQIAFLGDATLSAGDAVIELSVGQIDLRVSTLVDAMRTAVAEHLSGEPRS